MRRFWQRGNASLRKEITIIITIKLIAIFAIWWVFFSNPLPHPPLLKQLTQNQPEKRANYDNHS